MILTEHELDIFPSMVAIVAIGGTLVGVRLTNKSTLKSVEQANQAALEIARVERSSKREDELLTLKRTIYAKFVADLTLLIRESIAVSSTENRSSVERIAAIRQRLDASVTAANSLANVYLIAPSYINTLATEAYKVALNSTAKDTISYIRESGKLRATMRDDLAGQEFSAPEELERMTDIALARNAPTSRAEPSGEPD